MSKPLFLSKDEGFSEELAESVISLAESFVNEESTGKEEAQLRESISADTDGTDVPGSLDTSDQEQGAEDGSRRRRVLERGASQGITVHTHWASMRSVQGKHEALP